MPDAYTNMPELPDLELDKRQVDAHAVGRTVRAVTVRDKRVLEQPASTLERGVKGRRFAHSERHGKNLFIHLDDGHALLMHFGMTGYLKFAKSDETLQKSEAVVFELDEDRRLSYCSRRMLGRIELVETVQDYLDAHRIGPDALSLDARGFRERLGQRGGLKAALMDQSKLAGLGNVYSDETLFQAGLHPRTPLNALKEDDFVRLFRCMREVLETAIEHEGKRPELPADWLTPHRHEDERCPRCGSPWSVAQVGGRTTFWCPKDQPER